MNIRAILILFFSSVAFVAKAQVEISMLQQVKDNFIESELIGEVSYVQLQYEAFGTIAPDMEVRADGKNFFILDDKTTQSVYRFSENGELLNTITTQKQITGENKLPVLNNPAKFNINPTLEHVEIFSFENSSLNRFTYSGKKIDKIVFPVNPSDFTRDTKGSYWIYTGWNSKESQFRLIETDQNGRIIDKKMRLVTKCTPFVSYSFSHWKNKICMWELLSNTTYRIENNLVAPTFIINYGPRNLTDVFHSMDAYDSYQMLTRNGYYSIKKYLENDNYAYFFLNFTSESKKELFHIIYEKKNKKIHKYYENAAIAAFDKAQVLTDDNELIFLVAPRKIRQLVASESDLLPSQFDDLVEASKTVKNTMIVKIKLASPEDVQESK
jgi:hypothetical protein